MPDLEEFMDRRLDTFLDPVTPDQEPAYDDFTIQHLTVWPNRHSWRSYGRKTRSLVARHKCRQR